MRLYNLIIQLFLLVSLSTFTQVEALQCYACPVQSQVDDCTHITTCSPGKICMLKRTVDSNTQAVRYQTLCKTQNECFAEINKYQTIIGSLVGRKREMHQVVSDQGECLLQCCDDDKCNNGCLGGPSTVATTIQSTKPNFNIPTPPPHLNLTTAMPTTTKVFLIPTSPKPTTKLSTASTTPSTTESTTTPTTATTPTTPSTTPTTTTKATTSQKPIECAHGNYHFDNGCYIIPRQEMSFREAEKFCASYNASLVHVESAKENDFLKQTLKHLRRPLQYWIGIMDEIKENEWIYYDDHTLASFFDWMPGEPDGKQIFDGTSEADCAVFDPFADFQWRDEECSPYQFSVPICEKRMHPATNTTQTTTPTINSPVPGVTQISQFGATSSSKLSNPVSSVPTSLSVAVSSQPPSSSATLSSLVIASSLVTSPPATADSSSSAPASSLVTATASPLVTSSSTVVVPSSSLVTSSSATVSSPITSPSVTADSSSSAAASSLVTATASPLVASPSTVVASSPSLVTSSSAAVLSVMTSPTVTVDSSSSSTASSLLNSNMTTKGLQPNTKSSIIPTNFPVSSVPTKSAVPSTSSVSVSLPSITSTVLQSSTLVPSTTKRVCPSGAWEFEDSCYLHIKLEMSFGKAKKFCTDYNAHLVHVDSARENEYLKRKMKEINNPVQYWIGIMDEVKEDVWVFYDNGQNATYFDWSPGEPDNKHEFDGSNIADCAVFDPFTDYHWKDEECSPYHYSQTICEL